MKRKLFILLGTVMFCLFAQSKTLTISKTSTTPAIDGVLENTVWSSIPAQQLDQLKGEIGGFSAEMKLCYDANNLYVAIKVTDPTPNIDGASTWKSDCVELFLAMDTNNSDVYRPGDWQIRKVASKTKDDGGVDGSSNVTDVFKSIIKVEQVDGDSYIQEWALPWGDLVEDADFNGTSLRFDVQVAQANDAAVGRVGQAFWNSTADDEWNYIRNHGFIFLQEPLPAWKITSKFRINKVVTPPIIDGELDSAVWNAQNSFLCEKSIGTNTNDFAAEFKMCYDENNLYVAISVSDNTPNIVGPSSWKSDCVELFIDMNTANSGSYRKGDWQLRKMAAKTQEEGGVDGSANVTDAVKNKIKVVQKDGANYVQEWAIPWAVLMDNTSTAFNGSEFRFDMQASQANDPDPGRVFQLFFNSNADNQWSTVQNQSFVFLNEPLVPMDIIINSLKEDIASVNEVVELLTTDVNSLKNDIKKYNDSIAFLNDKLTHGQYTAYDTITVNVIEMEVVTKVLDMAGTQVEINMYPNPVSEVLNIQSSIDITSFEVYDLSGKLLDNKDVNSVEFQLNLSTLAGGNYVLKLHSGNGTITSKLIIKR